MKRSLQTSTLFLFAIVLIDNSSGFNVAPEASYLREIGDYGNPTRSSYFGYSVGLLKTTTSTWLLVGAPRANSSVAGLVVTEPGGLFKCELDQPIKSCKPVVVDTSMNLYHEPSLDAVPLRNNAWTGAALDIDQEGNVVVCAPRWRDAKYRNEYKTNGLCYILGSDLADNSAQTIAPLLVPAKQIYLYYERGVYYYSHGEVGMSVHFTNGSKQELLLGAPGLLNWQGSVAKLEPLPSAASGVISKRETTIYYSNKKLQNPIFTSKIQDCDYFGYSVTSGKFDSERDSYYVAGAPRGSESYGMVFIFLIRNFEDQPLFIKEERIGQQLGEYFGASVAAPDLNGDGLSDLVVGAPLHSIQEAPDAGCIYVYMNSLVEDGKLAANGIQLLGNSLKGARFGTSLGTPGDLNMDGFEDLLVGAPYENNEEGAVYIFSGYVNGIREMYSQKLTPRTVTKRIPLKGLGIAFSRPVDINGDKYPDFAVGSFLSDAALVMVTRPVIMVTGEMYSQPAKLSLIDKYFIVSPCISYSGYGVPNKEEITVTVSLNQESRQGNVVATFRDFGNTETQIVFKVGANEKKCNGVPVDLTDARTNVQQPIVIRMKYHLTKEDPKGPVMDPHAVLPAPLILSFITGCKNDICHSDLVTNAYFKEFNCLNCSLIIGKMDRISLQVDVINKKEPAFLPNVTLSIPAPLRIFPSIYDCINTPGLRRTTVVCQIKSPLHNDTMESLNFDLDVSLMDDGASDIAIDIYAISAADFEDEPLNNNFTARLKVEKRAKLEISGSSNPEQYSYLHLTGEEVKANHTVKLQHIFLVSKLEITPLGSVLIQVNVPAAVDLNGHKLPLLENHEHELTFHGKTYLCDVKDNDFSNSLWKDLNEPIIHKQEREEGEKHSFGCWSNSSHCKSVTCQVGPWERSFDVATLTISFDLNLTTLSHLLGSRKEARLVSDVYAQITSIKDLGDFTGIKEAKSRIYTSLQPESLVAKPLAWWVYVLAILGGLILLALIALVLYKIGFFRRKKKEELEAQKATLKTQTSNS